MVDSYTAVETKRTNLIIKSFSFSLRKLYECDEDKYLQKKVSITYWGGHVFKGQISCMSGRAQIRLQHMKKHKSKSISNLNSDFHHSAWFHSQFITQIKLRNNGNDITNECMDILKWKLCQSFILYCNSDDILNCMKKQNISKLINQSFDDNFNGEHLQTILSLKLFKKHHKESDIIEKADKFLFDLNRSTKYLMFNTKTSKTFQRIVLMITRVELLGIIENYRDLWVEEINKISILEELELISDNDKCERWNNYIDWDKNEIDNAVKQFCKSNLEESDIDAMFNTSEWEYGETKEYIPRVHIQFYQIVPKDKYTDMTIQKKYKNQRRNYSKQKKTNLKKINKLKFSKHVKYDGWHSEVSSFMKDWEQF